MANIKSAKKRIGVIERKTARNKRIKYRLKDILKSFETAVSEADKETARETLALAEKKLMQAAAKGTLHKNTASRKISRLTKRFTNEFGVDALNEKPEAKKPSKPAAKKAETKKEEAPKAEEADAEKTEESEPKKKSTKKESAEEATEDSSNEKAEEPKTEE